ncbi:MAG: acyl carrier protein [Nannocystaceae bacterium]
MHLTIDQLLDYLRRRTALPELGPETTLFSDGTVDSVTMIDLIVFLEDAVGIEIRQDDVTLDNFDTATRILQLMEQRTRGSA